MKTRIRRGNPRERGAVLVHSAVIMTGLIAFSALAVDYGIMWTARRQAQNAADSAAVAGATSLAFDSETDFNRARANAKSFGEFHKIFGTSPSIDLGSGDNPDITQDISFPPCPPGAPGLPDTCVRVNVYRNEAKDPLPAYFGRLFGRTQQGVKATATAQVLAGNASDCLRPFAIVDRWIENYPTPKVWAPTDVYNRWTKVGGTWTDNPAQTGFNPPDDYVPPTCSDPSDPSTCVAGSGFYLDPTNPAGSADYGLELTLKYGAQSPNDPISSGWFMALDLPVDPPMNSGADKFRYTIRNCSGVIKGIGDTIPVETGNMAGPTSQGTYGTNNPNDELGQCEKDPNATWDPINKVIGNSCAPGICADGLYYTYSPRIIPLPVFDIDAYLATNPTGSGGSVTITNILGFFILPPPGYATCNNLPNGAIQQGEVRGVLVSVPGLKSNNNQTSSFIRQVILVR